uniref:MFS domain-containing protein n=1 Tax=Trichuris muris TaxID=70415 RepID=A0A5S6R4A0_TRIMR
MPASRHLFETVGLAALGGSFQFYNFGVVNLPQLVVQRWMNETLYERDGTVLNQRQLDIRWSIFVSMISVGAIAGSLCVAFLTTFLGRKVSLLIASAANVLACALFLIAKKVGYMEIMLAGRLLNGICVGLASGIVPLYVTEIAPTRYRGAAGSVHQVAVLLGDFVSLLLPSAELLGTDELWPVAFAITAIPSSCLVAYLPFTRESPSWLFIHKRDKELARKAVEHFICGQEAVETRMKELELESTLCSKMERSFCSKLYRMFTKRELVAPFCMVLLVVCSQQFTAAPVVFSYSTYMFTQAGMDIWLAQKLTLGCGFLCFITTLPAPILIERLGRRRLSLIQQIGCLVVLFLFCLFEILRANGFTSWTGYAIAVVILLYMGFYGLGSPIPWVLSSEMFSEEYRPVAVTLSTTFIWLLCFVGTGLFLPLKHAIGLGYYFLFYVGCLVLVVLLTLLLLPETKNRSVAEIIAEYRRRKSSLATFTISGIHAAISGIDVSHDPTTT